MVVSDGETSQSVTPSPMLCSAEKPTSSRAAKNELYDMFEKFDTEFEKAVNDDKKATEELLTLERQKVEIFRNISESTEKLTNGI